MSAKIFIKGYYRHFIIDNSNITDYKVFYDNKYNNIQTKDDIVKSLGKNEKYVDNYVVKVFNNGIWVDLALLENYFNFTKRNYYKWIEILITSVLKTMYFFTLDFQQK